MLEFVLTADIAALIPDTFVISVSIPAVVFIFAMLVAVVFEWTEGSLLCDNGVVGKVKPIDASPRDLAHAENIIFYSYLKTNQWLLTSRVIIKVTDDIGTGFVIISKW